ncbi:MAG: hypothetical protein OEX00_08145 [Gammaproteobacteria bacterium]|nr:hypothetical protein [Gammaproteobacteria bacterium]MDH5693148.1 hypothetical protein [Gammaproteobacteria bacterium]
MQKRRYSQSLLFIPLVTLLSACVQFTTVEKTDLPHTPEDFKLEPAQLLEKYPRVKNLHTEFRSMEPLELKQSVLYEAMGEPNKTSWLPMDSTLGYISAMFGLDQAIRNRAVNSSVFLVPTMALVISTSMGGIKYYSYEKDDYKIEVKTIQNWSDDPKVTSMEWLYKGEESNIVTKDWLRHRKYLPWFFNIGEHAGGETYTNFDGKLQRWGSAFSLTVGRTFFIERPAIDIDLSISTFSGPIKRTPIELKAMRSFYNDKLRIGMGVSYSESPVMSKVDIFSRYSDSELDSAIGWVAAVEHRLADKFAFGLRGELISYKNEGRKIEGDNLGIYMRSYF